ncbi:hypothetical protein P7K49_028272 [Saguinus oedipus]|uniref:Laminin N-terminal domain-containing protein n=1 Tax=Saguinus oedipus TaxID=9490 RepID=A0ABQ9UBT3_SAGOE|nr:hypothetical protein P7K49_028272 [Saguinus oedipus]
MLSPGERLSHSPPAKFAAPLARRDDRCRFLIRRVPAPAAAGLRAERPLPRRGLLARGARGAAPAPPTPGVALVLVLQSAGAPKPLCWRRGPEDPARRDDGGLTVLPPTPLLLLPLLLALRVLPAWGATARDPGAAARFSLHPPYFNVAEAARIWATATCGERGLADGRPRPELYCKLVGGPTAPGSGHTIQVRTSEKAGVGAPSPSRAGRTPDEGIWPFSHACSWLRATRKGSPHPRARARGPGSIRGSPALALPARGEEGEASEVRAGGEEPFPPPSSLQA